MHVEGNTLNRFNASHAVRRWRDRRATGRPEDLDIGQHTCRIELGCGQRKIDPTAIGIDMLAWPGVDIVGQIPEVLRELPSTSVDEIYSSHFLEHLDDLTSLMDECARLLQPQGRFITVAPHFSNPFYYSDPTHRTFFGLYTMSYFAIDEMHRRQVPKYLQPGRDPNFELSAIRLRFERSLRRPGSWVIGRVVEHACGRSRRFREYYEYRLTSIVPCTEIRYELRRRG